MLKFAMSAQFSIAASCWMSDSEIADRICPQPNPGSQPLDGNISKRFNPELVPPIRPNYLVTFETFPFWRNPLSGSLGHHTSSWPPVQRQSWSKFPSELETVVSASPDSVGTHVLLIHQLLTELLKLPEHLRHLLSRHTARPCESRCSRISIPQSRLDHNRKPLDSNQNHRNSTLPLRYHDEDTISVDHHVLRSCRFESNSG